MPMQAAPGDVLLLAIFLCLSAQIVCQPIRPRKRIACFDNCHAAHALKPLPCSPKSHSFVSGSPQSAAHNRLPVPAQVAHRKQKRHHRPQTRWGESARGHAVTFHQFNPHIDLRVRMGNHVDFTFGIPCDAAEDLIYRPHQRRLGSRLQITRKLPHLEDITTGIVFTGTGLNLFTDTVAISMNNGDKTAVAARASRSSKSTG